MILAALGRHDLHASCPVPSPKGASGNPQGLPCVCRPQGWITIWKRIGQVLVLDPQGLLSA
ncbi:hypothetical protein [Paracoccus acridae]|uniref:hypothetical protein n=1 Tax=Paracoccus acridae TaxID=1795310 RepID=UPI001669B862|nr:hypothetical protein [Paracoccus acridae]